MCILSLSNISSAPTSMAFPDSLCLDINEYLSTLPDGDRQLYDVLSCIPESADEPRVRRSRRGAFIKCISQVPPYRYLARSCVPDNECDFQPPRWHYGYKFTYEQALALNQENAPDDERIDSLSDFQEMCDESVDVKKERSMLGGWWLKCRAENILEFQHNAGFKSVWDRGEKAQMFGFRDSWHLGDPHTGEEVEEISQLMFGKYVEPMWYLDASHCFWYEKRK
ncbi:hypothetical protein HGRIS_009242 [Hohenbuehelia grisea]|uniref:Uncharacterized protein n=1 Tax=Hohenbuehelia grisea TaxID=104357 RepID=A0ABR3J0S4_9AGAR